MDDMDFISEPIDYASIVWDGELLELVLKGGTMGSTGCMVFHTGLTHHESNQKKYYITKGGMPDTLTMRDGRGNVVRKDHYDNILPHLNGNMNYNKWYVNDVISITNELFG